LTYSFEILRANTAVVANQNATGITFKSSSPYKEADLVWAGGSFDLDSPINFAVMKRLKLKYGLPKLELL
jgi:hypothetical protein